MLHQPLGPAPAAPVEHGEIPRSTTCRRRGSRPRSVSWSGRHARASPEKMRSTRKGAQAAWWSRQRHCTAAPVPATFEMRGHDPFRVPVTEVTNRHTRTASVPTRTRMPSRFRLAEAALAGARPPPPCWMTRWIIPRVVPAGAIAPIWLPARTARRTISEIVPSPRPSGQATKSLSRRCSASIRSGSTCSPNDS